MKLTCEFCNFTFHISAQACPHCGRPSLFPNVNAAVEESEREALQKRYEEQFRQARIRGTEKILMDFQNDWRP